MDSSNAIAPVWPMPGEAQAFQTTDKAKVIRTI